MKKVVWSRTARKSLREITKYVTEIWNEQIAIEFLNQLDYRVDQIRRNPELGPAFEDSEFRELLIHKNVTLFYRNYDDYLKLLLVWDNRQDPAELLKKLTDANKDAIAASIN